MKSLFKAPRGTQDILPKDSYSWRFIENQMLNTVRKYGFKEIVTPTFEHTELFFRSVGDTSDIVEKEMYTFEDKGSRLITLRPEGTAGVARAAIENNLLNGALPVKLAYISACYRYEKPDSGRLREFHQFGVELFGAGLAQADHEVIMMAVDLLNEIKIGDFILKINSIGCESCRGNYKRELFKYFEKNKDKLCEVCYERLTRNPMRILDCKEESCREISAKAPIILDYLCEDCKAHFDSLKQYLDASQTQYIIDPTLVRGLDYYTKTVFEIMVRLENNDITICGGGRYDKLIEELGATPTPAIGFGLGLERGIMILNKRGNNNISEKKNDIYIVTLDEKSRVYCAQLIKKLRSQGYFVETDLLGRSLKAQMKYANKIGAKYSLVLGENEISKGVAYLKDMETSELKEIKI